RFGRVNATSVAGKSHSKSENGHGDRPDVGSYSGGHGDGGYDPRSSQRRQSHAGYWGVRAAGGRRLVRAAVSAPTCTNARVRRHPAQGNGARKTGIRRRILSTPAPGRHRTGQGVALDHPPIAYRYPDPFGGRGAEKRRIISRNRRRLAAVVL